MKYSRISSWLTAATCAAGAFLGATAAFTADMAPPEKPLPEIRFGPGERAPFLGIFTHAKTAASLDEKIEDARLALEANPHLAGMTIKIQWSQLHPERNVLEWDKLETLISTIAAFGKPVTMGVMSGSPPGWIFENGAVEGPGRRGDSACALPWDPVYMELFSADMRALAERYADDPRILMIIIQGHHYGGEEMHAPAKELFADHGWSRDVVLENWRYWIDLYDEIFPDKWLALVVSQMYPGESELPGAVAAHFVETCAGRAVLQTDQLNGREDSAILSGAVCSQFSHLAPNCHEMVGSFKEQPERQGSAEMTVYNFLKLGNPLYLQIWRRDADDPQYAKALLDTMETYGGMPAEDMKSRLMREGKYVEKSSWERE